MKEVQNGQKGVMTEQPVWSCLDCINVILSTVLQNNIKSQDIVKKINGHISPAFTSLHWLPVQFKIQIKILHLTYTALNGQVQSCHKELCPITQSDLSAARPQGYLWSCQTSIAVITNK